MSCGFIFLSSPQALTTIISDARTRIRPLSSSKSSQKSNLRCANGDDNCNLKTQSLGHHTVLSAVQFGAMLAATVGEQPAALAVTGENDVADSTWIITQLGIIGCWYLLIMPPIILNWLRLRWYKRRLFEMYLQFMFVFMFFPGMLLWAPFVNFRRLPRDPNMKYPWSIPQDPSLNDSTIQQR